MQSAGAFDAAALGASFAMADEAPPPRPSGQKSVLGLKHPPLEEVRVGMIDAGGRGASLMGQPLAIDGAAVTAVWNVVPERVAAAQARMAAKDQPSLAGYSKNDVDYENLCQRDDLDLV